VSIFVRLSLFHSVPQSPHFKTGRAAGQALLRNCAQVSDLSKSNCTRRRERSTRPCAPLSQPSSERFYDLWPWFFALRWMPSPLHEAQKYNGFYVSQTLVEMIKSLEPKYRKWVMSGDDRWRYWDNQRHRM
jgi:hypothetical protein